MIDFMALAFPVAFNLYIFQSRLFLNSLTRCFVLENIIVAFKVILLQRSNQNSNLMTILMDTSHFLYHITSTIYL